MSINVSLKNIKFLPYTKRPVKSESYIYDTLCNEFSSNFFENYEEVIKYIMRWRISKSAELSSRNVGKRIIFTENIEDGFFNVLGIPKEEVAKIIKGSKFVKTSWEITGKPFHQLLGNLTFFYFNQTANKIDYLKVKYSDIADNLIIYPHDWTNLFLAYKFFTSLQYRQFKYGADDEIMEYTLQNMRKSFDIVKAESLMQIIDDKSFTNLLYYQGLKRMIDYNNNSFYIKKASGNDAKYRFNKFTDENIVDYINYFWSRLSDFMVNISRKYYENHGKGSTSEIESREVELEEGKKALVSQTNISNDILSITRKILIHLQKDTNVDAILLQKANKLADSNYKQMYPIIDSIRLGEREIALKSKGKQTKISKRTNKKKSNNLVKSNTTDVNSQFTTLEETSLCSKLILNIVSYFIVSKNRPTREIHSSSFLKEMIESYSISNYKDPYITKIKEVLDALTEEYQKDYYRTQIANKKNAMRKCIYLYFVLYIAKYSDI